MRNDSKESRAQTHAQKSDPKKKNTMERTGLWTGVPRDMRAPGDVGKWASAGSTAERTVLRTDAADWFGTPKSINRSRAGVCANTHSVSLTQRRAYSMQYTERPIQYIDRLELASHIRAVILFWNPSSMHKHWLQANSNSRLIVDNKWMRLYK